MHKVNIKGDLWHLVKEKGSSLLWLNHNFTAALLLILAAASPAGDLAAASAAAVVAVVGVTKEEHSCSLRFNWHCVQVNIHLVRYSL